jgi:fructosamine-3-kinase
VRTAHLLADASIVRAIERAASAHRGRAWVAGRFVDLSDRASHPCAILHGEPFSVFAKLDATAGGGERLTAELHGLNVLRERGAVATPTPVAGGMIRLDAGSVLLLEAVPEVRPEARTPRHWRSIGRALAAPHQVHDGSFGLGQFNGFFGPFPQDNRPVRSNRWSDFYAERRLIPGLRAAVDAGRLPPDLAAGVERIIGRLPSLCGPEPRPSLLHGDAQQNNVLTTATGAVMVDPAPYFGHPEIDLALVDYFQPVPDDVFDAYRDLAPIDPGFPRRRELWRLHGYLAVVTLAGASALGRSTLRRIADAVALYR